ncbi:hypothetical protein WK11_17035 [Burkholderia ubonensis]|uniref:barstar family protein n=1 Tax=Burkholderia ubonensis TaxID=101571 RepID=UPI00075B9824|nr:barstar family protein [Burkholderia ubonensis]KVM51910.1 hypothetical protein WJ58_20545 [Burkholderia ubonensis]KVR03712.1 hypothetical protein WK11_17035 [Burkholderia ubonensis]KVV40204.1 hypothetical protein WK79_22760 [Burkholderia ubonensis]KWC33212.1 hypothetical protein WL49_24210 [Burkholderia ubonensis]KWC38268.1 hypothetical protein WL48_12915 [Burkholderia ubonensis]
MDASDVFVFVPESRAFMADDAFVARIAGKICTEQQLFESFFRLLTLPGYFGFNWNALFDCLRDFHWIDEKNIVIVHDELPELSTVEMRIYLEVLRDAVVDWKPGEAHSLQVVFNDRDRARVEAAMS